MRPPNFYSHPGFERAGLRRRDTTWILERIADPGSLFVPVWRNQNLVIELEGGEPRAAVLQSASISEIFGATQERLARSLSKLRGREPGYGQRREFDCRVVGTQWSVCRRRQPL
jgi:hypothetical protein